MNKQTRIAAAALATLAALTGLQAQAQSRQDELKKTVAVALGRALPNGPADTVNRLMNVRPDGAISRGFNPGRVAQATFGRGVPVPAPDCRQASTAQKEADEGDCLLDGGQRDDPTGAYTMLSFSKNVGMGNIKFYRRAAFKPGSEDAPRALRMSDEEAYKQALAFAELLGIPKSEIPLPPPGAKNPYPVRTLVAGIANEASEQGKQFELQKVVVLPRAFNVPGGLLRDGASGVQLNHVIAPGQAVIALNDSGVQYARVDGWSDAQMDPKLDAKLAKSASALIDEITEDLYNEGVRRVGSMSILIGLRKAYPNPDDPNPPLCWVCGVLRPAVKVIVSQAGPGAVEATEKQFFAPGLVREYDLVQQTETERAAR